MTMTMTMKYHSDAFAAIHETMEALHEIGANFLKVEPDQEMTTEPVAGFLPALK